MLGMLEAGWAEHLQERALNYLLALLGLGVLYVAARRRWLTPAALQRGPDRSDLLHGVDLLGGLALMFVGGGIFLALQDGFGAWLMAIGASPAVTDGATLILMQLLAQGPVVMYFLVRATMGGPNWRQAMIACGVWPRRWLRDLQYGLAGLALTLPVVMGLVSIVTLWFAYLIGDPAPPVLHETLDDIRAAGPGLAMALLIVGAVVLAPVLEEVIFRGLVQTGLLRPLGIEHRWTVVLIASVIFAAIHFNIDPEAGRIYWHSLPMLFVLGVILGWLYERTGSLWPPIVVHAGFNALNVAIVLSGMAGEAG